MTEKDTGFSLDPDKLARLWSVCASEGIDTNMAPVEINGYRITNMIGEGGMGFVYLAEQDKPIKRKVALKIIKPGMDSKQVIARFEAERQALALLDHPNIAHIYDAGTTKTGRPYFVMEYIKGMPITQYCDRNKLSIEERLKLFIQVCKAIQHAHQKGIIHRDIKPSNIIVSVQDGKAVPKVIDFGVAKAISMPLTEKTMFTQQGQLIGTPEYMSPEQADLKEKDIDTRTDIYSLGVVLYELLAGALPFEPEILREGGYAEIQRIIREEEPPRPSTKLSSLGENATKVAESRHIELSTLVKSLHKELEWIPLMAIRKNRDQRYKTASDLAEDVQNYLDGNPLVAGPESIAYRFKKVICKYRIAVILSFSFLMFLFVALVLITSLYINAENERQKSQKALYYNQITTIKSEFNSENAANAQNILQRCPEDLRHWEYEYLSRFADQSIMTIRGHEGSVRRAIFTPDGKHIVSGGYDGTIRIWDAEEGTELKKINTDQSWITYIRISPDGKQLVSCGKADTIKLWDLEKGDLIRMFHGHDSRVDCIDFSPDGNRLVSGGLDSTVRVWDIETEKEILLLTVPKKRIASVAFSPEGNRIIAATRTGSDGNCFIKIWDSVSGSLIIDKDRSTFAPFWIGHFWDIEVDTDRNELLSANWGQACTWDVETLELQTSILQTHRYGSRRATFSPDGKHILTGGVTGTLKLWNRDSGILEKTFHGHHGPVWSVAFSPDGREILSSSSDGTIKVWDIGKDHEKILIPYAHPNAPMTSVSFNPDGTKLASGGQKGHVRIWKTETWEFLHDLPSHSAAITGVRFSPDGKRLLSADKNGTIRHWDMTSVTPCLLKVIEGHSDSVNSVAYSPDGNYFASGSSDKTIKIWDAKAGDLIETLKGHSQAVDSICYSEDGNHLVSGSSDKTVRLWDIKKKGCVNQLTGHEAPVTSVAISSDGYQIASGDESGHMILWDRKKNQQVLSMKGHLDEITGIVFSTDHKRIFSSSTDDTIRIWSPETDKCVLMLGTLGVGGVHSITLSPDQTTIAAAGEWFGHMIVFSSRGFPHYDQRANDVFKQGNINRQGTRVLKQNPRQIPTEAKCFDQHKYLLYTEKKTWTDALQIAQSVGGHLAAITTKEENDWIIQAFPTELGEYWLGGTDEQSEGQWKWITGENWTFSYWSPGEPNNKDGDQHALQVSQWGQWDDNNMNIQKYFLIEWEQ